MEQEAILQEADMKELIQEVLSGAPEGLDEESLKAGVALLIDIETTQNLLKLLQTRKLLGRIRADGRPDFLVCDDFAAKVDSERIV